MSQQQEVTTKGLKILNKIKNRKSIKDEILDEIETK